MANALAAMSGLLVVVLHLYAGAHSYGHPLWRPFGEPTMLVFPGWFVSVATCVPVLILTRGRSRAAIASLAITLISAALIFVL